LEETRIMQSDVPKDSQVLFYYYLNTSYQIRDS
jgi:hypothetical protein